MPNPTRSPASVQELLGRLAEKSDDRVALKVLEGRALSRSAKSVHVAVSGGIVAVPIANIEEVVSTVASQPDMVRMVVRNPHEIEPLLRVRLTRPGGSGTGGASGGAIEQARDGDIVYTDRVTRLQMGAATYTTTDTDTITGGDGQPDASDDCVSNNDEHPDDLGG